MNISEMKSVCNEFLIKIPLVYIESDIVLYKKISETDFKFDDKIVQISYDEDGIFVVVENKEAKKIEADILKSFCSIGDICCRPIQPDDPFFPIDFLYENTNYSCIMAEFIEPRLLCFPENKEVYDSLNKAISDFEKRIMSNVKNKKGLLIIELDRFRPYEFDKLLLKKGYTYKNFYFYKEIYKK